MKNQSAKKRRSNSANEAKRRTGKPFELAVTRVQRMMDANTTVLHDMKIVDRDGIERQFDVVIKGHFGGMSTLGVVECRDHKRKLGLDDVEAFSAKSRSVNANIALIVSRSGFTENALKLAKVLGVGTMSLVDSESMFTPTSLNIPWYGVIHDWTVRCLIEYCGAGPASIGFPDEMPKYDGKPVLNFFCNHSHPGCMTV